MQWAKNLNGKLHKLQDLEETIFVDTIYLLVSSVKTKYLKTKYHPLGIFEIPKNSKKHISASCRSLNMSIENTDILVDETKCPSLNKN